MNVLTTNEWILAHSTNTYVFFCTETKAFVTIVFQRLLSIYSKRWQCFMSFVLWFHVSHILHTVYENPESRSNVLDFSFSKAIYYGLLLVVLNASGNSRSLQDTTQTHSTEFWDHRSLPNDVINQPIDSWMLDRWILIIDYASTIAGDSQRLVRLDKAFATHEMTIVSQNNSALHLVW